MRAAYIFFTLLGYVSGSVLYAYYLPLWLKGIDITEGTPDRNPGVFNCVSKAGWPVGVLAAICELAKGAVPVLLAARFLDTGNWLFALVIAAPAAGHAWPLFRCGGGGKGIAVSFGVTIGLLPLWRPGVMLAFFYLFFSLILRIQPHRLRSLVTYLCFCVGILLRLGFCPVTAGCLLMAAVVIQRHSQPEAEEAEIIEPDSVK